MINNFLSVYSATDVQVAGDINISSSWVSAGIISVNTHTTSYM
jgi:hypothetical protein